MTQELPEDQADFLEASESRYHAQVAQTQMQQYRLIQSALSKFNKRVERFKKRHPMDSQYAEQIVDQDINREIEEIKRDIQAVILGLVHELQERNEKIAQHFNSHHAE